MIYEQWIEIISSAAIIILTGGLVWATWRYARSTKKMANFMEVQTAIMRQIFEQKVSPIFKANFQTSSANDKKGRFHYIINNLGKEVFYLKEVRLNIFKEDEPDNILQSHSKPHNKKRVAPYPDREDIIIEFEFSPQVSQFYQNIQERKKIKFSPVFIVEDINNKIHDFGESVRTLF